LRERGVSLFYIFLKLLFYVFLVISFVFFVYFLKGRRGYELFKNLLRREGIGLIPLFWKKNLLKDGNGRWIGCKFYLFKALIVDGGEGHGLYFFSFLKFHCNFLESFILKGARESGVWGF
jgi:hypothetical protein